MIPASRAVPLLDPSRMATVIAERFRESGRRGTRVPVASRVEWVEEGGLRFIVRVLAPRASRDRASGAAAGGGDRRALAGASGPGASANDDGGPRSPFLPPYDPTLLVGAISPTHLCILNKFNVVDHHVLVVTRGYEDQEVALTAADLGAASTCLGGVDGLAFFNGGAAAGASQAHKHLQVVPLPLAPGGERFPLAGRVETALAAARGRVEGFAFRHRLAAVDSPDRAWRTYRALLADLALERPGGRAAPYNLLMTRRWMLLVARSRGALDGIEVNALGFAGTLLVAGEEELSRVRERGPLEILRRVAVAD